LKLTLLVLFLGPAVAAMSRADKAEKLASGVEALCNSMGMVAENACQPANCDKDIGLVITLCLISAVIGFLVCAMWAGGRGV